MADNDVRIRISATNESGPAFNEAESALRELKAAAADAENAIGEIGPTAQESARQIEAFKPDMFSKIKTAIGGVGAAMGDLGPKAASAASSIKDSMGGAFSSAASKAREFNSAVVSSFGSAVASAGKLTLAIGGIATGLGATAIGKGVLINEEFETYELRFKGLLGSMDAAKAKMSELSSFAASTPFELPQVVKASMLLETFGGSALNSEENLKFVGNAAATAGQDFDYVAGWIGKAYAAIQANKPVGEAAGELLNMGIASSTLASDIEALQKTGASTEEVWKAFQAGIKAPETAMTDLAGSAGGLKGTLSDTFNAALKTIGAPFFDLYKAGLGKAIEALSGLISSGVFDSFAAKVQGMFASFAAGASSFDLSALFSSLGPLFESIKPKLDGFKSAFDTFIKSLSFEDANIGGSIGTFIANIGSALGGLPGVFLGVYGQLISITSQFISDIASPFINDIPAAFQSFLDFAQTMGDQIMAILQPAIDVVKLAFDTIALWVNENQDKIRADITETWGSIKTTVETIIGAVKAIVEPAFLWLKDFVVNNQNGIKTALTLVWDGIKLAIDTTLILIKGAVDLAMSIFKGDWSAAWTAIKDSFLGILDAMPDGAKKGIDALKKFISDAIDVGKGMVDGVVKGIMSAPSKIKDAIMGLAKDAWSEVKRFFGISSPSRLMANTVGKPIIDGIAVGIKTALPDLMWQIRKTNTTIGNEMRAMSAAMEDDLELGRKYDEDRIREKRQRNQDDADLEEARRQNEQRIREKEQRDREIEDERERRQRERIIEKEKEGVRRNNPIIGGWQPTPIIPEIKYTAPIIGGFTPIDINNPPPTIKAPIIGGFKPIETGPGLFGPKPEIFGDLIQFPPINNGGGGNGGGVRAFGGGNPSSITTNSRSTTINVLPRDPQVYQTVREMMDALFLAEQQLSRMEGF